MQNLKKSKNNYLVPLFRSPIKAGFPSATDGEVENILDLNSYLITHPASTYLLRVKGDSMLNAGILNNDILIVDRSITAENNSIVIAALDGEFTVKRLIKKDNKVLLRPENENYEDIVIKEGAELEIWGVVIHSIHSFVK